MVGVELAVAVVINPILLQLDAGASLTARAYGARMLGRAMPFWYVGSLVLAGALAAVAWGTSAATASLVAAALLVVTVLMSVLWLVPINNRSSSWTAEDHPADWREQHRRWDRLHIARVAFLVAAFALVGLAAALI
ncbi:DUF1772 domain-containing protein [Cellulomonas sp. DKR-3]|uniref:DUF1772 domain-containing protein n=2 Tax=Cellulomonas fulva TaxID=2835530 RepID=A0ABS5TUK7_9CELL|nr:DUF1772 domain-containing protein [Cellulomonas fulva]